MTQPEQLAADTLLISVCLHRPLSEPSNTPAEHVHVLGAIGQVNYAEAVFSPASFALLCRSIVDVANTRPGGLTVNHCLSLSDCANYGVWTCRAAKVRVHADAPERLHLDFLDDRDGSLARATLPAAAFARFAAERCDLVAIITSGGLISLPCEVAA